MRTFIFFAVLFAMFIFAIVAGYKPSMIEKEYNKVKEPIQKYLAEKQARAWQQAKDNDWQAFEKQIHLPSDCSSPKSEIRKLECNNQWNLQVQTFERIWANKVRSGWTPDSIN